MAAEFPTWWQAGCISRPSGIGSSAGFGHAAEPLADGGSLLGSESRLQFGFAAGDGGVGLGVDNAFIHAMHVGGVWTMIFPLAGAAVLTLALRPRPAPPTAPEPEPGLAVAGHD